MPINNAADHSKYVYSFEEGSAEQKHLLGGKGAGLAEMTRIGLPVPAGFTITTEACRRYFQMDRQLWPELKSQVEEYLRKLEEVTGKQFGGKINPLLVSVRSGAVISMPGMMDTILNLGLNDNTVSGLLAATGDARFAYDCYRRFVQMFGEVVLKVEHYRFERILDAVKEEQGVKLDSEFSAESLQKVVSLYKEEIRKTTGRDFPESPMEQLFQAIQAVFDSWQNRRAVVYRRVHEIPDDLGTAVNVQAMVFGNTGTDSGTGVAFTRNPSTGENELYGEYLINAQGEDVVAGVRTPKALCELAKSMLDIYDELQTVATRLERHYRDMQDIEFTIENGCLYLLQTRTGKRTAAAAVKIAVDMVAEGLIDVKEALLRVDANSVKQILHRSIDPNIAVKSLTKGLPASPGAASGRVVFDADDVAARIKEGEDVILVRPETTPDDIHGIVKAAAIVTTRGGMTSHAAVVARGMGKPCVCGCEELRIDLTNKKASVGKVVVREGDIITVDGASGRIFVGEVKLVQPQVSAELRQLLQWADQERKLRVRANADTPEDARRSREFGAEGIGLCRTEHMFMSGERLPWVRRMIMSETVAERKLALDKLLEMQMSDFAAILEEMRGLPVTIRLLDPPLHEFLPQAEELIEQILKAELRGEENALVDQQRELLRKVKALREQNPMLGHRGCRLAVTFPEIYVMQVEAIARAAYQVASQYSPGEVQVEIMIPLVSTEEELTLLRELVEQTLQQVADEYSFSLPIRIGTMIELPRACVTANHIAKAADFFSFGTNDLTQMTFGFSRDDAESKFLPEYLHRKILSNNPFAVIDTDGVGQLIKMACRLGRSANERLKIGVCGEHGGNPESIRFFNAVGLDYVSCSPFRVPVARLAAAQAALRENE